MGIFVYAGHGLQVEGVNYLVPVDYDNPSMSRTVLGSSTIALQPVLEMMEKKQTLLNLCLFSKGNKYSR